MKWFFTFARGADHNTRVPHSSASRWSSVLLGGVVVGSFDALFAVLYWRIGYGVPPSRIFQSIAAGLLGPASFEGGPGTAWLGAALHYGIATTIVAVYYAVSVRLTVLVERPFAYGLLYGLAVYAVMNYAVIPLSAAQSPKFNLPWVASSIAVHALLIGVPAALFARRARAGARPAAAHGHVATGRR
jgi:hypothetical protein